MIESPVDRGRWIVAVDPECPGLWQEHCAAALAAAGMCVAVRRIPGRTPGGAEAVAGRLARRLVPLLRRSSAHAPSYDDPSPDDVIVDLRDSGTPLGGASRTFVFRFGDERERGALPLARAFARGDRTIRVALEQRDGDVHRIVHEGTFGIPFWYPAGMRHLLREIAQWPARCAEIAEDPAARLADAGPIRFRPLEWHELLRFGAEIVRRGARELAYRLFVQSDWAIGLTQRSPAEIVTQRTAGDVRWLANPAAGFLADPFVCREGDTTAIFVEAYDEVRGRGVIEAAILDGDGVPGERRRIIEEPYHLSYPCVVRSGGDVYIVPEGAGGKAIVAYRAVRFPFEWVRERTLIAGLDAVDSTVFERDGRWWILCSVWSRNAMLSLFAFYADAFDGPYHAHACNPIVIDIRSARPAGTPFEIGGRLVRPAQDCSDGYGSALALCEIVELTPERYREIPFGRLEPAVFGKYSGVHTLGSDGGWTAIDVKSERVSLRPLLRLASNFIRRAKPASRKARYQ